MFIRIAPLITSCFLAFSSLFSQTTETPSQYVQDRLTDGNRNLIATTFVSVGNSNNHADPSSTLHLGHVSKPYQIGMFDVTASDYCAFLNAVASTRDDHGLYNSNMTTDPNVACLRRSTNADGSFSYSIIEDAKNRGLFPITYVSWRSAARFCNWLQNGALTSDLITDPDQITETGAYDLTSSINGIVTRSETALYFLPTEDEWYKAAYYNPAKNDYYGYPTKSYYLAPGNNIPNSNSLFDSSINPYFSNQANYKCGTFSNTYATGIPPYLTPVGTFFESPGPYGTFDMGGDVWQWTESVDAFGNSAIHGGSWQSVYYSFSNQSNDLYSGHRKIVDPESETSAIGFRIAGPAEPINNDATSLEASNATPLDNATDLLVPSPQTIMLMIGLLCSAGLIHFAANIAVWALIIAAALVLLSGCGLIPEAAVAALIPIGRALWNLGGRTVAEGAINGIRVGADTMDNLVNTGRGSTAITGTAAETTPLVNNQATIASNQLSSENIRQNFPWLFRDTPSG